MEEAAAAIGCSLAHFKRHVMPELGVIRRGMRNMIPVHELERWVASSMDPAPVAYRSNARS
jgi:hypothetical protein